MELMERINSAAIYRHLLGKMLLSSTQHGFIKAKVYCCLEPGPDHPWGGWSWSLRAQPGPPGTTKIYKVGPLWAPKYL